MIIKFHSFVDVITNSSSTIYTRATKETVDAFKTAIDGILKLAGSELKADDVFTFEIEIDGDRLENWRLEMLADYQDQLDDDDKYKNVDLDVYYQKVLKNKKLQPDWWDAYEEEHEDEYYSSELRITPKNKGDKVAVKAAEALESLIGSFEQDATFD